MIGGKVELVQVFLDCLGRRKVTDRKAYGELTRLTKNDNGAGVILMPLRLIWKPRGCNTIGGGMRGGLRSVEGRRSRLGTIDVALKIEPT